MNIVQFKTRLVEVLVGERIDKLLSGTNMEEHEQHKPIHMEGNMRLRCVYCTMRGKTIVRTRYKCAVCGVPLC